MSSQIDGHMQLPSSYNFNKETPSQYRRNTIDPNNFQLWIKNDMYGSTYAKHHSPVHLNLIRIRFSRETHIFLDIQALSQRTEPKVCMQLHMPT